MDQAAQRLTERLVALRQACDPEEQALLDALLVAAAVTVVDEAEAVDAAEVEGFVDRRLLLSTKAGRLAADNRSIDAGMQEAGQKADLLMSQATVAMMMGIVGSSSLVGQRWPPP